MFDGISTVAPPICAVISGTSGKNALPSIDGTTSTHGTASSESTTERELFLECQYPPFMADIRNFDHQIKKDQTPDIN